jgi:hypothetical protein
MRSDFNMTLRAACVACLTVFASCVSVPLPSPTVDSPAPPPSLGNTAVPASPVTTPKPTTGELVVRQRLSPSNAGFYTEGAFAFVEIRDAAGTLVGEAQTSDWVSDIELLRTDLAAGQYQLRSYVRPCEAACPYLDPPTDECTANLTLEGGRTVEVLIERAVGMCVASTAP